MSEKNFMAYGDAESIFTGYANRIKQSPTTFVGTRAQWDALSLSQKAEYTLVDITDDEYNPNYLVDWESYGKLGTKNLNSYPYYNPDSFTSNGVTFLVQSDGSVIANGTATANTFYIFHQRATKANSLTLPNGKYILSGCPSTGSNNTYKINANRTHNGSSDVYGSDVGQGLELTLAGDDYSNSEVRLGVYIYIYSGVTLNNVLFKPMITLASVTDSDYEHFTPYAATNRQLTEQAAPIDDMNNILGAKNLLPNHNVTQVIDGITFTVNNDGTVTATGTSTALVVFDVVNTELLSPFKLNSGTYILTDGLTASQYEGAYTALTLKYTDDTVEYNVADTSINKNQFTVDASTIKDWYFGICIRANKTVNITFKPMVRPASIKDATYVPYSKTNSELTVELSNFENFLTISEVDITQFSNASGHLRLRRFGRIVIMQIDLSPTNANNVQVVLPNGYKINGAFFHQVTYKNNDIYVYGYTNAVLNIAHTTNDIIELVIPYICMP